MSLEIRVAAGEHELSGIAGPGEGWGSAAERIAAALPGRPYARDLSGATKRFIVDDRRVAIRAMTRGDLADVARWRRSAHVHRWWAADGEPTEAAVTEQYAASVDGATPTRLWVAEVNGRSVGMLQDYRISDYPEFALLTPDPDAIGVDYLIGEPAHLGRGVGTLMLWAWLGRLRRRFPDARHVFAAPDHRNEPSLRLLDRVGFDRGIWFDEPQPDGTTATVVGCTLDLARVLGG